MSRRFILALSIGVLMLPAVTTAAQAQPPPTVVLDGGQPVPLAAQARRTRLLGTVELYSLAPYVEGSLSDRARLVSAGTQKALRIEITQRDDLRRPTTVDWRRELIPLLEAQGAAHLRGTFAPVRQGDVVLVEYVPGRGTTVRVNKVVAVSGADHDLMLAFLDHWLGERPVSDEVKRALLGSS